MTAAQLVAHLVGDYLLQSHWMAVEKTKRAFPAACHALAYGLPFAIFRPSVAAWCAIAGSHFVIDRWRLARHLVWAKNLAGAAPHRASWAASQPTGYPPATPPWLATWLLIIADNTVHVLCNAAALRWLT